MRAAALESELEQAQKRLDAVNVGSQGWTPGSPYLDPAAVRIEWQ